MSGWNDSGEGFSDVRCLDKVERWPGRIPDVRHPGGTSENFRPSGTSKATCGGLRMMKINGNRSGVMDGDVGMLDKTMNNKREWVWGC